MRVRSLGLERYGAFEGRLVELGPALTLVVGANEAGKSTTLDALSDLLWTFRGTRQSFHYGLGALSLTADLDLADHPPADPLPADGPGAARVEIRRRNAGLQTIADGAPFTSPWGVGGAEARRRWRQAFGLSHAALRAGGDSVFQGTGDLAELVFTARSGRAVRGLLEALGAEMDALYKAHRGNRNVRLRAALTEYEHRSQQAASGMTRAGQVEEIRRERRLRRDDAELMAARSRAAADRHALLEQWARAAPLVRDLVRLRGRHAALLAAGPVLTAEQTGVFDSGSRAVESADSDLERLAEDLRGRQAARAALTVDVAVLADEEAISRLERACVARLDDARRARELTAEASRRRDETRGLLLDLAGPADGRETTDLLHGLHVPRDLAAQLDARADTVLELADELLRAEKTLESARTRHQASTERSPAHDAALISLLRAVTAAIRADGSAAVLTRDAVEVVTDATRDRREALRRAGAHDPDAPPPPMPSRGEIRLVRERFEAAEAALARREEELVGATRDVELADGRLAAADGADLPDQTTLADARAARARVWGLLAAAPERAGELLPLLAAGIARADEVADQLIRHADRTARRGQLQREVEVARGRAVAALAACSAAADEADQARARWEFFWRERGLAVPAPDEADDVHRALDEAQRAHTELLAAEARIARLAAQTQAQRTTLADALAELGLPRPDADLDSLLNAAEAVLADDDTAQVHRADARHFARAVEEAERDHDKRRAELRGAEQDWDELVRRAGLASVTGPLGWRERRVVLTEAAARHEEARRAARDAAEAAGRYDMFAAEVRELAVRHGLVPGGGQTEGEPAADREEPAADREEPAAVADLVEQLAARRRASLERRARAEETDQAVDALTARVAEVTRQRDAAAARLGTLSGQLDLPAGQTLAHAVARSREAAEVAAAARAAEDLIRAAAPAGDLETLVADLAGRTDEDLAADLAGARDERDRCAGAHREAWTAVGNVEEHLRELESGASAGELHAQAQESLALVAESAERYLVARIQYETLGRELEAYERRHASPLLADAGRLLERLTEGRYVALRAVDRGDGQRTLRVVRSDEHELGPGELSEGTADQVYLALRLAAIDQLQRERTVRGEPTLPVVLDDVLMTFDDDRAGAALRMLAGLSRHWQIIVLTHHEHLTDIARTVRADLRAGTDSGADGSEDLVTVSHLPAANALPAARPPEQIRALTTRHLPDERGGGPAGRAPVPALGGSTGGRSRGSADPGPGPAGRDGGRIRSWARRNGFEVSDRGRIPREILDAFDLAHAP